MNREERSSFALRLRTLRKAAHMTQCDVADKLNIHRTAYTKYETDRANPDKTCLVTLADLFGVSVDELLGKEMSPTVVELHNATQEVVAVNLTPREQELLVAFRRMTLEQQEELLKSGADIANKDE